MAITITIPPGEGTVADPFDAFFGDSGTLIRQVDVYNADGTPYYLDAPVTEGSISVDMNRDERRTLDVTFDNDGNWFRSDPSGFWYDKVIKVYRGVMDSTGILKYLIGEFVIDRISSPHFPKVTKVTGRDRTKTLMMAKFPTATGFVIGNALESVIQTIAVNGGITKLNLPTTGITLTRDFYFDLGSTRWDAIRDLAENYSYEVFFSAAGVLTMRPFVDPTTAPVTFSFGTGPTGNLGTYELSTNDTRIFNDIIVTGSSSDTIPVSAQAQNTEPSSPTRIDRLGRRTYVYESKVLTTSDQCLTLAQSLLKIMALESYELEVDALVVPWLEAGVAVEFIDPDPAPEAPTRFLLTNFEIPLTPSLMSASARRVTIVK